VRAAGERLDVQRLRRRWAAGHLRAPATRAGGAAASAADVVALGQALDAAGDLVRRVGEIAELLNELGPAPKLMASACCSCSRATLRMNRSASMDLRRTAISSDVVFMALRALRFALDGCIARFGDGADPRVRYPVVAI
jgi:hypothetical protein